MKPLLPPVAAPEDRVKVPDAPSAVVPEDNAKLPGCLCLRMCPKDRVKALGFNAFLTPDSRVNDPESAVASLEIPEDNVKEPDAAVADPDSMTKSPEFVPPGSLP